MQDDSFAGHVTRYLREHFSDDDHSKIPPLIQKTPRKWSVYPPMVLFNTGSFDSDLWLETFDTLINKNEFFRYMQTALPGTVTHFAINKPIIEEDAMRRPFNIVPLWGDFGPDPTPQLFAEPFAPDLEKAFWCTVFQNGIHQTWAPRYTMFSRGNIKEKKRILDNYRHLEGTTVLDLYAGIGYFTLSYLANGATVFCWEINPWSIEGLVRGLQKNGHMYKVFRSGQVVTQGEINDFVARGYRAFVFHESNECATQRLAAWELAAISHVNLGLLPSLKPSWPIARFASTGSKEPTIVHVHENVHKDQFTTLVEEVQDCFAGTVTHLEKVKTFAPDVWHVVVDVVVDVVV
ncbi:hypothetical protein METBIDRAFT_45721 [Metschnikowia bicuspidata var. bicuspidata NRRL YB-4993]|uniref:tRNA wybutosine-synthesizing protein 2 n=1 Tax=Metschnikowia bicuspidata var. bicuspidata NRRL YB-4993 TaxID=869754 RepID=A0A1A0H6W0_9ASCO|nr:hypothetical protein METBIDRAFT_45721 [Metschnikowia bicuspidata var. bicuspidata NRRL YB-4993]OBA19647.1 hypothetical protein METBIDRAFT_45721 [Metschnikowia bicuspidata var. bicuspidata NRRL YB-4993]